ncbi:MAG TPA: alpha/beta hydrolase [Gaiellaceae bacterium]|nr:alpha/beta hydrolase [Gaiellaceae bacterium]
MLRDGRRLGYAEYGKQDGRPGFYFHGHPGCRLEPRFADADAAGAGIRVIALDRPGCGLSDFQPGRTLLDWPRDVRDVADELGLDRFSVLGVSGGGPYALACAHELPDRVAGVGVVSGVAPYDAPGATEGMRRRNRVGFKLGARVPPLARFAMWSMRRQVRRDPDRVLDALEQALPPSDAEVVRRPGVRRLMAEVFAEAFRQGSRGPAWDLVVLARPWPIRVDRIEPSVHLWQGEDDPLVPPTMGRYLAGELPSCDATFLPGEGHLLVFDHLAEILDVFA